MVAPPAHLWTSLDYAGLVCYYGTPQFLHIHQDRLASLFATNRPLLAHPLWPPKAKTNFSIVRSNDGQMSSPYPQFFWATSLLQFSRWLTQTGLPWLSTRICFLGSGCCIARFGLSACFNVILRVIILDSPDLSDSSHGAPLNPCQSIVILSSQPYFLLRLTTDPTHSRHRLFTLISPRGHLDHFSFLVLEKFVDGVWVNYIKRHSISKHSFLQVCATRLKNTFKIVD